MSVSRVIAILAMDAALICELWTMMLAILEVLALLIGAEDPKSCFIKKDLIIKFIDDFLSCL